MTTAKELKDFIALDSAVAEDGLFKKLGAAVKGAISGAKAGFAGGGSSSAPSEGDGKATGKGKYGLQHPDGTPCDAKKPESCPIMRKQLAEQEEAGKKEEPSASGAAAEEEKKADKADDLSKESPSAESKKDDDDRGGASFFPEDDDKKEEDKPITIKKVDKPAEEAKEDKPITLHKVVGGEKSGKEATAKGRWVTPEEERAKADAEYFKKLDDKKREEAKKAEAAKEAAAKKEADDRKAEHEADVAKVKERDAAEPSIPVSKPPEESLTDLTAKWDTAAKVCTERNQALRKAISDGAGLDEIARLQKDVHDANTALSKIGEKIDAHHKKSLEEAKAADYKKKRDEMLEFAKKAGERHEVETPADDDEKDGLVPSEEEVEASWKKREEAKKPSVANNAKTKMAMLDKAIKDGTERESAFSRAARKEGIPASAKDYYYEQMKAARADINKAIDEQNKLLADPKTYEGMSREELSDEYEKANKESKRLYDAESDLLARPSYAGKKEDVDKARKAVNDSMARQTAIRTALKKATAADDAKKYIDGLKSSSGKKTPSPEAQKLRDAFSKYMDPSKQYEADSVENSIADYLTKEGFAPTKFKSYIEEIDHDKDANYFDACFKLDSEADVHRLQKAFSKMMKASGIEWGEEGKSKEGLIDIRPRKHVHKDGSNYRARVWFDDDMTDE